MSGTHKRATKVKAGSRETSFRVISLMTKGCVDCNRFGKRSSISLAVLRSRARWAYPEQFKHYTAVPPTFRVFSNIDEIEMRSIDPPDFQSMKRAPIT